MTILLTINLQFWKYFNKKQFFKQKTQNAYNYAYILYFNSYTILVNVSFMEKKCYNLHNTEFYFKIIILEYLFVLILFCIKYEK